MRLLIDSVPVGSGGLLHLRDELSTAAARQAPAGSSVVLLAASPPAKLQNQPNLKVVSLKKPRAGWAGRWWWYNRVLPRLTRDHQADVVYSLSGILPARVARGVASVTTVNNMVPFSPVETAEYPPWSRAGLRFSLLRRLYVRGLRRADSVVLHSRNALALVTPYTGDISQKTFVALTGVPTDVDGIAAANGPHPQGGKPYLLYFSAFYPYKNHIRLIEAYKQSISADPDLPDLILAGMPVDRGYFERVMKAVTDNDLGTRIRYVGTVARADIPSWIYNAEINFFPSTCETNPITVAEIIGLGGVLACSTSGPMPEIVGEAAEYFDPLSVESIARAIANLAHDPRRRAALRELGRTRAAQLSWDECGAEVWRAARRARTNYEESRSAADNARPVPV